MVESGLESNVGLILFLLGFFRSFFFHSFVFFFSSLFLIMTAPNITKTIICSY
jgi:hypothetical protein